MRWLLVCEARYVHTIAVAGWAWTWTVIPKLLPEVHWIRFKEQIWWLEKCGFILFSWNVALLFFSQRWVKKNRKKHTQTHTHIYIIYIYILRPPAVLKDGLPENPLRFSSMIFPANWSFMELQLWRFPYISHVSPIETSIFHGVFPMFDTWRSGERPPLPRSWRTPVWRERRLVDGDQVRLLWSWG